MKTERFLFRPKPEVITDKVNITRYQDVYDAMKRHASLIVLEDGVSYIRQESGIRYTKPGYDSVSVDSTKIKPYGIMYGISKRNPKFSKKKCCCTTQ